jgi:hypothetical protein
VPCARAGQFAGQFLTDRAVTALARSPRVTETPTGGGSSPPHAERSRVEPGTGDTQDKLALGLVAVGESATDYRLMKDVAHAMRRAHPDLPIVVIGRALHDLGLMKIGNVFVTGAVEPEELPQLLHQYRLKALLTATRRPQFGHPLVSHLRGCGLPIAFFDWSLGRVAAQAGDLPLDPRTAIDAVAAELTPWLRREVDPR